MSRQLTSKSTLENLKREAKRWLKALRGNIREARERLERVLPNAPSEPTLRDVQLALAREHGVAGWTALKERVSGTRSQTLRDTMSPDERVAWFIQNACPDHSVRGADAHVVALGTARRLLALHPEIATDSLSTAIVCGDVDAVKRHLRERPETANEKGGPKNWEPLLYLTFTRLPFAAANDNALDMARLLLDHGADPKAYFMAGDSFYTPLVGAIGEGEEDRPPHPRRDELARLLLERGAEPYDIQVVYNIHFHGRILWFMNLMYEFSVKRGRRSDWDDPEWRMLDMGGYGSGARWHLWVAIEHDDMELLEWCLEHGANPNSPPMRDKRFSKSSLYEDALRLGNIDAAEMLVRYGAVRTATVATDEDAFHDACFRLDRETARRLVAEHPEFLQNGRTMFLAAKRDRVDVIQLLLDVGMSPDVHENGSARPLHAAAIEGSVRAVKLLIERGADVNAREEGYDATPLGWAVHAMQARTIDVLVPHSRDTWNLCGLGRVDRLRELIAENPDIARRVYAQGPHAWTDLMNLPDDDETAETIVKLYMSHGANLTARNPNGLTAADIAMRRGMVKVAALLSAA